MLFGSGDELPLGTAGQLDGNGGLLSAWAWRLHGNFWDFLGIFGRVIGAPCDTPGVCGAAVWNGSGEDEPQGYGSGAKLSQG